jgi:hypothetical protein
MPSKEPKSLYQNEQSTGLLLSPLPRQGSRKAVAQMDSCPFDFAQGTLSEMT